MTTLPPSEDVKACIECGGARDERYGEPYGSRIRERQKCFMCVFWDEWVEKGSDPRVARIEGNHYYVEDDNPSPYAFRGFGGREFKIAFNDGRRVTTRNLWHQGEIPAHYRDRLPENASWEACQ